MKSNGFLMVLAVVAVVVALANVSFTSMKMAEVNQKITGFASSSETGKVNITIATSVSINMSRSNITWGNGTIDVGQQNSTLYTSQENAAVVRGNWQTTNAKAFILDNVGNVNCSLILSGGKSAYAFIGGTNPQYQWNVTNKDDGSCAGGGALLSTWYDVNSSAKFCTQFGIVANSLYIDILLTVPNDANKTGEQTDTITASASTAG